MPRLVLSVAQVREWETGYIERGVPGLVLMENAGRGAAHILGLRHGSHRAGSTTPTATRGSCVRCADERGLRDFRVLIVTGPGNNGGDGFVVARHLFSRNAEVRVLSSRMPGSLRGDARTMAEAFLACGGKVSPATPEAIAAAEADVVVDALLGTGITSPLEPSLAALIAAMNAHPAPKVALDIPSGLLGDSGAAALGPEGPTAVLAEQTLCFGHLKLGLLTTHGHAHGGRITVSHIGVPSGGPSPSAWLLEPSDAARALPHRLPTAHKGQAGHVGLVAGSPGMTGAAHLAAQAALSTGAGVATILTDSTTHERLDREVMEVMVRTVAPDESAWDLARIDSLVVGPGLGRSSLAEQLVQSALKQARTLAEKRGSFGVVIDADGLRSLGTNLDSLAALARASVRLVLTPHPAEAAALLACTTDEIESDRFSAARRLAEQSQATILLKGSRTIVAAPGEVPWVSALGSPCLATAGSGDVLSGCLGALLAEASRSGPLGAERTLELTTLGVALHGISGELFEQRHGAVGARATDILALLPDARKELSTLA
jgi:ADP-dependent NAD(P)H-hydrate dehydratase / NAD(P)H-hydrate epimerase